MKISSVCLFLLLLVGCAKEPQIVYKTNYQEVKIPVVYELERPKRPKYTINDTALSYLLKLKQYTITLETIIDKTKTNKERE